MCLEVKGRWCGGWGGPGEPEHCFDEHEEEEGVGGDLLRKTMNCIRGWEYWCRLCETEPSISNSYMMKHSLHKHKLCTILDKHGCNRASPFLAKTIPNADTAAAHTAATLLPYDLSAPQQKGYPTRADSTSQTRIVQKNRIP